MKFLQTYGLYGAWLVSLTGFFMSLYFSEMEQMEPCSLCWLQRIALFPLILQLGIATFFSEPEKAFRYCFPLVLFGLFIGLYQSLLPELKMGSSCNCEASSLPLLFEKIPFAWISVVGFLLMMGLLFFSRKSS
jgi:disulfide bond formation protein DsbB